MTVLTTRLKLERDLLDLKTTPPGGAKPKKPKKKKGKLSPKEISDLQTQHKEVYTSNDSRNRVDSLLEAGRRWRAGRRGSAEYGGGGVARGHRQLDPDTAHQNALLAYRAAHRKP